MLNKINVIKKLVVVDKTTGCIYSLATSIQHELGVKANSNKTDCVQRNLYKAGHAHNLVYHKGGLVYSFPGPPTPTNICV